MIFFSHQTLEKKNFFNRNLFIFIWNIHKPRQYITKIVTLFSEFFLNRVKVIVREKKNCTSQVEKKLINKSFHTYTNTQSHTKLKNLIWFLVIGFFYDFRIVDRNRACAGSIRAFKSPNKFSTFNTGPNLLFARAIKSFCCRERNFFPSTFWKKIRIKFFVKLYHQNQKYVDKS